MAAKVFILHGWSIDKNNHQKWEYFRDLLVKKGIESEMLGIPGLSAPLNEVWNLDNYVTWLEKELQDKKKVILLGHSFGGQISTRYAATHPEKVSQLILIDSGGIRDHSLKATVKRNAFFVAAKIGGIFFHSEVLRNVLYKLARERDYKQAPPLLRRTMSSILDDEVVNDLPKIKTPTLIVWGKEDKVTPLFLGRIFQQKIPGNRFEVIEEARHSPQYTHPDKVVEKIASFLQSKE